MKQQALLRIAGGLTVLLLSAGFIIYIMTCGKYDKKMPEELGIVFYCSWFVAVAAIGVTVRGIMAYVNAGSDDSLPPPPPK
jgi:hypothetical protein